MKDDQGSVISKAEYKNELEERVAHFLETIPKLPRNERKVIRARMPDSSDPIEQNAWCREEFRRIKEGHFGMTGKMYFWYNYVVMDDEVRGGLIRPEFRICQATWFDQILEAQNSKEWGLICVKRRRVGASWLEAADVLHDAITRPNTKYGMTSKSEADAIALFRKVRFIYDNLPDWLRPRSTAGNSRMYMDFSYWTKDTKGNKVRRGTQSAIQVKAPTDTAWEGFAMAKFVADEVGKYAIKQLHSYTEPALMKGTRRAGTMLYFGTAGDITKEGADFRDMFYNGDNYKLKQFFLGGWMGLDGLVDDLGNDLVEEAVRWIVYERHRREGLGMKEYTDFIQQYPLTVGEAFTSNESYGVGNSLKINKQINALTANPPQAKKGYFMLDNNRKSVFVPSPNGKCIIYEEPEPNIEDGYVAGGDSTDHEVKNPESKDRSGQAMIIMKKRKGLDPPKIVFEYFDKPMQPRDFYDQSLLALMYYNNTKILIERNRYGMITYFDENGFKHLLATKPQGYASLIANTTWNIGYYRDAKHKLYGEECASEYIEDYCDYIPSTALLKECLIYGQQNTDLCAAFLATLIYLKEDKWEATSRADKEHLFKTKLVRTPSGGVKRVHY